MAVEFLEDRSAGVFYLVLRASCSQRFREVAPEAVEPGTGHLEDATDVAWTVPVQKDCGLRRVPIASFGTVAVPLQESKRNEGIEKVRVRARA